MLQFALRRPKGMLTLAGIGLATAAVFGAQQPEVTPTRDDEHTLRIVAALLEHNHFSKPTINDEISKRWCRNFLKALDPLKYHFLQADVDQFLKYENELDDTINTGKLDFEKLVFDRFLKRVDERQVDAMDILNQKVDFTVDESIVDDPERMTYPADAKEAKDRLRKLIKLDLLRLKLIKTDEAEAKKQLVIRYRDQHRYYHQFDNIEVLERYITALTTAIDPHSTYMGPREVEDMVSQQLHKTLDGIGASLLAVDGFPTVQDVVEGGAAAKDGRLQEGDKIVGIVNPDGTRETFVEKKLGDVVRKIRGARGTKVKIIVIPAEQIDEAKKDKKDKPEEVVYELTRQKIDLNDEKAKGHIIDFKAPGTDKVKKYGILSIPSFYGDSAAMNNGEADAASVTRDCRRALEDFKAKGVEAVVVDLRGNPGGLLDEAISLSGLFIDKGPVVQVREATSVTHQDDLDEGTAWDGPLVMVIDHFCASASEILAGVIKDYGRGLIVGDNSTYGKGTVQNIVPLGEPGLRFQKVPKFGALKLTIRQFYLPNGDSTQIRGVRPDLHIPSFGDVADFGESRSDTALKFDKVAPLPHDMYNRVPANLLAKVTELSDARRKANPKFQEEEKYLAKYAERKQRHEISLNEAKFKAESRADDEVADEAKPKSKTKGKKTRRSEMTWEPGYYNDEILSIANDYTTLGSRILAAAPVRAVNNEQPPLRP